MPVKTDNSKDSQAEQAISTAHQYKDRLLRFKQAVKEIESKVYITAGKEDDMVIEDFSEELKRIEAWKGFLDSELERVKERISEYLK